MIFPDLIIVGGGLLTGLIVGSFLTVVITRYGSGETIVRGRSRCASCKRMIRWYDNIPVVSYIILGGTCRCCMQRISLLYPSVEAVTAVTFGVIAFFVFAGGMEDASFVTGEQLVTLVFAWSVAAALIVIFFYDLRTMHIPMAVVWVLVGVIVAYGVIFFGMHAAYYDMWAHVLGGAVGFLFLFMLSALSRERWMGAGDAYIGLIGGLLVGFPTAVFFLTASFALGALVGMALIVLGIRGRKDAVPFAPFLVAGIAVTFLVPHLFPSMVPLLPYF